MRPQVLSGALNDVNTGIKSQEMKIHGKSVGKSVWAADVLFAA
jgi:hypothetical protein